jgi:hypothetical protein
MNIAQPPELYFAEYTTHFHDEYAGNPFIEALKEEMSEREFKARMHYVPELPSDLLTMPFSKAQLYIKELERAYIYSPFDYDLYRQAYTDIVAGYKHRNPMSHFYHSDLLNTASAVRTSQSYIPDPHRKKQVGSGNCSLLSGLSGIGKTEKVRAILKMLPPVIRHTEYDKKPLVFDQLVTVSFEISYVKSVKSLALNFFAAVDAKIGTEYVNDWINGRPFQGAYLKFMEVIAKRHGIGLVHIDECQKLLAVAKDKDSPTIQLLESLFNNLGVPLIMTCTEEGRSLFEIDGLSKVETKSKFTTARRLTSNRDLQCERIVFGSDTFRLFLDGFIPYTIFAGTPAKTAEFEALLFDMSQGVHQVLSRLIRLFLENVHRRKTPPNEFVVLLENIFNSQFKLLKPALYALKDGDIQKYEILKDEAEKKLAESEENGSQNMISRTLHSSLRAPKMATEEQLVELEK